MTPWVFWSDGSCWRMAAAITILSWPSSTRSVSSTRPALPAAITCAASA
jgi:hypothetical protein